MPFHGLNTIRSKMQVLRCPFGYQTEFDWLELSENSPDCRSGMSKLWVSEWVWSDGGMVLTGETVVLGEKHYAVSVVDGWMGMEHRWNGTDRGN